MGRCRSTRLSKRRYGFGCHRPSVPWLSSTRAWRSQVSRSQSTVARLRLGANTLSSSSWKPQLHLFPNECVANGKLVLANFLEFQAWFRNAVWPRSVATLFQGNAKHHGQWIFPIQRFSKSIFGCSRRKRRLSSVNEWQRSARGLVLISNQQVCLVHLDQPR